MIGTRMRTVPTASPILKELYIAIMFFIFFRITIPISVAAFLITVFAFQLVGAWTSNVSVSAASSSCSKRA